MKLSKADQAKLALASYALTIGGEQLSSPRAIEVVKGGVALVDAAVAAGVTRAQCKEILQKAAAKLRKGR